MTKKILVVEDARFTWEMLKEMLSKNKGYEIVGHALDGVQAIEMYKKLNPDLVTMDIIMPKLNGVEAIKKILEFDKDAKILVVSAIGEVSVIKDALDAGAKDYLCKPFTTKKLMETIERVLSNEKGGI